MVSLVSYSRCYQNKAEFYLGLQKAKRRHSARKFKAYLFFFRGFFAAGVSSLYSNCHLSIFADFFCEQKGNKIGKVLLLQLELDILSNFFSFLLLFRYLEELSNGFARFSPISFPFPPLFYLSTIVIRLKMYMSGSTYSNAWIWFDFYIFYPLLLLWSASKCRTKIGIQFTEKAREQNVQKSGFLHDCIPPDPWKPKILNIFRWFSNSSIEKRNKNDHALWRESSLSIIVSGCLSNFSHFRLLSLCYNNWYNNGIMIFGIWFCLATKTSILFSERKYIHFKQAFSPKKYVKMFSYQKRCEPSQRPRAKSGRPGSEVTWFFWEGFLVLVCFGFKDFGGLLSKSFCSGMRRQTWKAINLLIQIFGGKNPRSFSSVVSVMAT